MTPYPIDPDEMRLCLTGTEEQRERCIQRLADWAHADGYHLGLNDGAACAMRGAKSAIGDSPTDPLLLAAVLLTAKP